MKVIETLYQRGLITNPQDDIRPAGAKYPRKFLAMMHPEGAHVLNNGKHDKITLDYVNEIAAYEKRLGPEMSWFAQETAECNCRQSFSGKHPGRSHDRELAHYRKAEVYWGSMMDDMFLHFYDLRSELFPREHLGELGGWVSRPELEEKTKLRCKELGLV